jgi:hypothetical protein
MITSDRSSTLWVWPWLSSKYCEYWMGAVVLSARASATEWAASAPDAGKGRSRSVNKCRQVIEASAYFCPGGGS